jgi:hypothetical protein
VAISIAFKLRHYPKKAKIAKNAKALPPVSGYKVMMNEMIVNHERHERTRKGTVIMSLRTPSGVKQSVLSGEIAWVQGQVLQSYILNRFRVLKCRFSHFPHLPRRGKYANKFTPLKRQNRKKG